MSRIFKGFPMVSRLRPVISPNSLRRRQRFGKNVTKI